MLQEKLHQRIRTYTTLRIMGLWIFVILVIAFKASLVNAQEPSLTGNDIPGITEGIKSSYKLEKLNEYRLKLRSIDFSKLKNRKEQEQYAEAYKTLAFALRNHRYIRPGYDIYLKYISLRDTIMKQDKAIQMADMEKKYTVVHSKLLNEISTKEEEKKRLVNDKASIESVKKNYLTYTIVFTLLIVAAFFYILSGINRKFREAKRVKEENRSHIQSVSSAAWKGQMSAGALNRISYLNKLVLEQTEKSSLQLMQVENELKSVKETSGLVKNIHDDISRLKQLAEITSKGIDKIMNEIPVLKLKIENISDKASGT